MKSKLEKEIVRRNEIVHQFYEGSVGEIIRRARILKNITQESVARGICSNTYISKLENNQISPNRDNLFLIMERVDVPFEVIELPKQMVLDLHTCLKAFIRNDKDTYYGIVQELAKYDFGIIVEIIRFGYAILQGEKAEAARLYKELFHYFNSMDNYAFSVFLLYAIDYHHLIGDYQEARYILEIAQEFYQLGKTMVGYTHYQQFLNNGYLGQYAQAMKHYTVAKGLFVLEENQYRIQHLDFIQNQFAMMETNHIRQRLDVKQVKKFPMEEQVRYLCLLARMGEIQADELALVSEDNPSKGEIYYEMCHYYLEKGDVEQYQIVKGALLKYAQRTHLTVDYYQLLQLEENEEYEEEKEFYMAVLLPTAIMNQDIVRIRKYYRRLSQISFALKKYKDAALFLQEIDDEINRLRGNKKN